MNEICFFKEKLKNIIDLKKSKIWLSEKQGKRIECIYKIGTEQFIESVNIFENNRYILLGQNIDKETKIKILEEINE